MARISKTRLFNARCLATKHSFVAIYKPAEDESVDDIIALHTRDGLDTGAGVQIAGRFFVPFLFNEAEASILHGAETRSLDEAMRGALEFTQAAK